MLETFRQAGPLEKCAVIAIAAATVYFFGQQIVVTAFWTAGADFPKHWLAAKAMLAGNSPYYGEELYLGYNYPLFIGVLGLPLGWFETVRGAEVAWDAANVLLTVGAGLALGWFLMPREMAEQSGPAGFLARWWPLLVFFLLATYDPLHVVMNVGNVEPWNLLFGGLFVCFFVRKRDGWAGMFLALFALIKVAPVLLVLGVFALRRWRILAGFGATLAVYGLLLLVTGGWRWESALYTDTLTRIPHYWQGISFSIHRWAASLFAPDILQDEELYRHFILAINVVAGSVYALCCAVQWWTRRADDELFLAFACFFVLMLSPLVEATHFTWVIPALLLQARALGRGVLGPGTFAMLAVLLLGAYLLHFLLSMRNLPFGWTAWQWQTMVLVYAVAASGAAAFLTPRERGALAPSSPEERGTESRREGLSPA